MDESTKLKWEGRWEQLKGKVRSRWGELTDDDLDIAAGDFEQLVGAIKERTGEQEEAIKKEFSSF